MLWGYKALQEAREVDNETVQLDVTAILMEDIQEEGDKKSK